MRCSAVILTGGRGERLKYLGYPKQFYNMLGKPVFVHILDIYEKIAEVDDIYLVINEDYAQNYSQILGKFNFKKIRSLVAGGVTRQDSVDNAISALKNTEIVVLQDGANPTTQPDLIRNCIKAAREHGASSAALSPTNTVVTVNNNEIASVLERSQLAYTVSPQVYRFDIIANALKYAKENKLIGRPTVELVKNTGNKVVLVPASSENVKISVPEDLIIVEKILDKIQNAKS